MKETEDLYGSDEEPSVVVNFDYDYDDFVIDTESGEVQSESELNEFGEFEEEDGT